MNYGSPHSILTAKGAGKETKPGEGTLGAVASPSGITNTAPRVETLIRGGPEIFR